MVAPSARTVTVIAVPVTVTAVTCVPPASSRSPTAGSRTLMPVAPAGSVFVIDAVVPQSAPENTSVLLAANAKGNEFFDVNFVAAMAALATRIVAASTRASDVADLAIIPSSRPASA